MKPGSNKRQHKPYLNLVIDNTRGIVNNATGMAMSKTAWMFPEGEIEYSIFSKVLISALTGICAVASICIYHYAAIAIWLTVFKIGGCVEWVLNMGPKLDEKRGLKANYYTLLGPLVILTSFKAISMIIDRLGWQWAIFIAGLCYIPDAGAYICGKIIIPLLKIKPWIIHPASPKKSWQALLFGGLPASMYFNLFVIYPRMPKTFLGFYGAATLIFLAVFVGAFGDMFESAIKRATGMKDSSILLGPMGGFVDRIDSWLTTSILVGIAFAIKFL